jgi:hypothetical protein
MLCFREDSERLRIEFYSMGINKVASVEGKVREDEEARLVE